MEIYEVYDQSVCREREPAAQTLFFFVFFQYTHACLFDIRCYILLLLLLLLFLLWLVVLLLLLCCWKYGDTSVYLQLCIQFILMIILNMCFVCTAYVYAYE